MQRLLQTMNAKVNKTSGRATVSLQSNGIFVALVSRSAAGNPVIDRVFSHETFTGNSLTVLETMVQVEPLKKYRCSHLLNAGEYQLLTVDTPAVPQNERKEAMRWIVKDMLDFPAEDATIDILAIPLDKSGPIRSTSMFVVVARNSIISQRQKLFETAALELAAIDIPETAQRNISALLEPEGKALALLSLNADGGLMTITFAGELYLSRRMDITLVQLKQADLFQQAQLHEQITLELQRSLDHFYRQHHEMQLSKLVLAPMGQPGADLLVYLDRNLNSPVELLDMATIMDCSATPELLDADVQQKYFLTLGAALRIRST
ncbi:agglutinin biogenesis protein MshI [Actimicrobium sp. CCC2.4]|uniref:type IV pilus biogenesis protein PilM n=1 Tax=Actimicrobium sp. CCC2.4 TaxID=3048606 RepID=UPI002AC951CD|nr:agglutinin biogenesis protein MshI [Actimicrobium sp. CCC2.4]MEB0134704.1 agglutinin biogenesis protein MshI [Actimicrobium sp. CCC2.4]WPX30647.1 agglutinin biogenesis protein MshI [Actimicrobium sp. CCC2.4]